MKKTLFILVFALVFFAASIAMAKINFGVKYLSLMYDDYKISPTPGECWNHFYSTVNQRLGFNMGFDVTPQIIIFGSLDINLASWTYENDETDMESKFSTSSFTPNLGAKFYFRERQENSVCPYISAGLFKTFTSVDLGEGAADLEEYVKKVNSPFGLVPAFGAEYFFSENFGLGGEMGWIFSFAKGEFDYTNEAGTKYTDKATYNTVFPYIALTLNFRL
jgi:hypothetical protein